MKLECPCHGCKDRKGATKTEPACHSYCERHAVWKAKQIEQERKKRSAQEADNMMRGYAVETTRRNQKRRKHGD